MMSRSGVRRAVRRVRRGMRPVVGFRQVPYLDRRSGVSSSEHEDGTVLSLAVAEAALRRCGGSGPRSENGLRHGTYRPFGNRPWPEAWERPIRPGRWRVGIDASSGADRIYARKRVRPVRDRPISVNRCYRFVRRPGKLPETVGKAKPLLRIIRYGSPVSGKAGRMTSAAFGLRSCVCVRPDGAHRAESSDACRSRTMPLFFLPSI